MHIHERAADAASSRGVADLAWLARVPERLRAGLVRCASGETPANVAVMQLHADSLAENEVEVVLADALQAARDAFSVDALVVERLGAALDVARTHRGAFAIVKTLLHGLPHCDVASDPQQGVARWAAAFDAAVRAFPEASVALYALGDPRLLRAATNEVVELLRVERLLGPGRDVLEIGCGIGRFQEALAPEVKSVVGIDISAGMIAAARKRCEHLANVRLLQSSGRDLAQFTNESFDVVLAVDAFPYVVQSGMALAATHFREAARVLRRDGQLLVLNFSYRGDTELDRADVARLAAKAGLRVLRDGTREFALWDALTFQLAKPGADG